MRTFGSIEPIADDWRRLAEETRAAPFLWPGWITAWLEAFGEHDLRIHTAWRAGRLVGLLPVQVAGRQVWSASNDQSPVFGPLALDAAAASTLLSALVAERPARLQLGYLDPDDAATAEGLAALRARGYRQLVQQTLRAPHTEIAGEWETFLARLSRNRRKALRRTERRLREQGDLRVEVHTGGDLDALLEEGFAVEASGWKGRQGTAINSSPPMRRFYRALAHAAADDKSLRLVFLRLDDHAIAFEFVLRYDDVVYDLKGGFDERFRTWGPGIWLLGEVVRDAFETGARRIEWLGTDDDYKLEWSDGTRRIVTATWYAPGPRSLAEYHARTLWRSARTRGRDLGREHLPAGVIERLKALRS